MTEQQAATTRFCARAAGPFLLIIALMVFTRYETLPLLLPSLLRDAPLVMITGTWTTILGLIMLSAHHHVGSAVAFTITLLAMILTLRGVLLLVNPEALIFVAAQFVSAKPAMYAVVAITFLLGAWLSYAGWIAKKV